MTVIIPSKEFSTEDRRRLVLEYLEQPHGLKAAFLEANLLDRLHMAIAPLLIGDGRPAIRLPARAALGDCQRPRYRVFRMGGDVLFDCELTRRDDESAGDDTDADAPIARII